MKIPAVLVLALCLSLSPAAWAMGALSPEESVLHLFNRLAFGPRPDEAKALLKDRKNVDRLVDEWLEAQMNPARVDDSALEKKLRSLSLEDLSSSPEMAEEKVPLPMNEDAMDPKARRRARQMEARDSLERLRVRKVIRAVESERQLEEVLTDFWFNHFNVDGRRVEVKLVLMRYEDEAIRKNVFGSFSALVKATAESPAMLRYLGNDASRLKSPAGKGGINENYARELMELHTLGVDGGYTQDDVIALARILTGWSVAKDDGRLAFRFKDPWHDRGETTFLKEKFPSGQAKAEGDRAIAMLAVHPQTAKFITGKLIRYFVGDEVGRDFHDRLAQVFLKSSGDLRTVYRALFTSPEFWSGAVAGGRIKKPLHFTASAIRALDGKVAAESSLPFDLAAMGEALYQYGPPTGYPDTDGYWMNPNSFGQRLVFVNRLVRGNVEGVAIDIPRFLPKADQDPIAFLEGDVLHKPLHPSTRKAIREGTAKAGTKENSKREKARLLNVLSFGLGSPDFEKR